MLKNRQFQLVQRVLNLNESINEGGQKNSLKWKVLIYDDLGIWILSTLLKVSRLLEVGVTIHGHISKKRDPIPDVSAVYLVQPTKENVSIIANDIGNNLFDHVYVNFISPIDDNLLKEFAESVARASDGRSIKSIVDQYINFSSPDPGLFTLFESKPYFKDIYGYRASDESVLSSVSEIAMGLVSVFLNAGEVPRILHTSEGAGSYVAQKFSELISPIAKNFEIWETRKNTTNGKYPLLILLDRTTDLVGSLLHPSTYQALIFDHFGIKRNQVSVGKEVFDLDTVLDKFWLDNKGKIFNSAAEAVQREFSIFKTEYGSIRNNLENAVTNLQDLSHKQMSLSAHTKICDALLASIKSKQSNNLYQIECDILSQEAVEVPALLKIVSEIPEKDDKLRLLTIAYLCDLIPKESFSQFEQYVGPIDFLDRLSKFKIMSKKSGFLNKVLRKVGASDSGNLAEKLPVVQTTNKLLKESIDGFRLMNPLTGKAEDPEPIGNVYVFIVGPGNYLEYQGLMELASKERIEITYGCTSILRPSEFLQGLAEMVQ